ncbi:MAG: single-stranded DNA-binding protein [Candidatus Avelusimicrobium sp.]
MLNTVCVMGRFTRQPELKRTQSGLAVCSFGLACDRAAKKGEDHKTDWLDVVAWRGTAEFICKYFNKGDAIIIVGSLQTRNWDDKDGNKRKVAEIIANNAFFAGGKRDSNAPQAAPEPADADYSGGGYGCGDFAEIGENDGDLPF